MAIGGGSSTVMEAFVGAIIGAGATGALFGLISGPGAQHGKTANLNNTLNRYKNPANKPKHLLQDIIIISILDVHLSILLWSIHHSIYRFHSTLNYLN